MILLCFSNSLRAFWRCGCLAGMCLLAVTMTRAETEKATEGHTEPQASGAHPIQTKADSMDFDQKTGEIVARGNVAVTCGSVKLFADRMQVNRNTKEAHAEGHVRLRQGFKEWTAESLDYNFDTGAMKAGEARAELSDGLFFYGKSMESSDRDRYVLKDSYFTTSDYEHPGYRVKASSIIVYPNNRIALHNLVLFLGPVPVFYFPYLVLPADDDDSERNGVNTGSQVQVGSKSAWGFFVLNSYTTRVDESFRPTFRFDYRTHRGVAGGVDVRYKSGEAAAPSKGEEFEPRVSGKIRAYYADDKKQRESGPVEVVTSTSTTTQTIAPERYQARVTQRADMDEEVYSKLKVNKLSDPNFLEDFFEKEFQEDPQPDSFLEVTKWSPNTTLSLMGRPRFNNFFTTTERLPELRYDLKRQPVLESPVFYEGENSASYLSHQFANNTPGFNDYHSGRVDTFHQFLYPKQYFGWLNLTPKVGGRATFYDETRINTSPSVVRGVGSAGIEASFKSSRTWRDVSNTDWEIDGLRHVVEPSVNYGFVARPSRRPNELFQFDADRSSYGINKNLTPIDFPQYTGVDSINKRNVFRPALRQRLQTKRDGATWDLAELLIYQDILADKTAGEKTFSDLFAEFSTKPVRWLSLGWGGRYDYDQGQIRESTSSATVFQKKDWKVALSHYYFRDVGNQMGVSYSWAINENWAFRTNHRFDPSDGSLFEQAYSIDRDLHSWILSLSVSQLRPANHDSDFRIWLAFVLKAFPEVSVDSTQIGPAN
ncbi:MAG: LPS-assembly protein LptD [Verrucomicrobia bacterium]|nr:LPS-assembly protein LptD [Verrucomicrobiota bacterium]